MSAPRPPWPQASLASLVAAAVVLLAAPCPLSARTIAEQLHQFIDRHGFPYRSEFPEAITPIIERLAVRGVDFPVTATALGFTYRFNFELGVPERSSDSLGPVFVERADTVGRRRLDVGLVYLHANLTRFDGDEFADQIVTAATVTVPGFDKPVRQGFAAKDFSLVSDIFSLSATYGVTERLDVNVLLPLVRTSLDLSGTAMAMVIGGPRVTEEVGFSANAFGVGDLFLRAKYRFLDEPVKVASILALRLPTGEEGDFHGIGDTTVYSGLVVSRTFGRNDLHGSLGVEIDADDLERTRARYAVGVSLQPLARLAFLADVIGSSSFVDDTFTIPNPAGPLLGTDRLFGNDALIEAVRPNEIVAFVPRSDVVDIALGLKVSLGEGGVAFAGVILPLTTDGLRAQVIPNAGVQWTF